MAMSNGLKWEPWIPDDIHTKVRLGMIVKIERAAEPVDEDTAPPISSTKVPLPLS